MLSQTNLVHKGKMVHKTVKQELSVWLSSSVKTYHFTQFFQYSQ